MKVRLFFIAAVVTITVGAGARPVAAKDYRLICNSVRLVATDRAECHRQMKAAANADERAKIYRAYDLKIAGFNPDGTQAKK